MRPQLCQSIVASVGGCRVGVMSLTIAGCGDGRIATYEVNGQVNVNGRPAEGAIVIFCPVDPPAEVEHLRPAGMANASGQFTLTTFEPSDGAPAGQYKVLVKWPRRLRPPRSAMPGQAARTRGRTDCAANTTVSNRRRSGDDRGAIQPVTTI